jgi:hypothetical protein
LNHK